MISRILSIVLRILLFRSRSSFSIQLISSAKPPAACPPDPVPPSGSAQAASTAACVASPGSVVAFCATFAPAPPDPPAKLVSNPTPGKSLKSSAAVCIRSLMISAATSSSPLAYWHICLKEGIRLTGVIAGSVSSSKSPNLCKRTRSKALTSFPEHGSVA